MEYRKDVNSNENMPNGAWMGDQFVLYGLVATWFHKITQSINIW
jgi:hypothetical protein